MSDLSEIVSVWREQASVLRARGHTREARTIDALLDEVSRSARAYLNWLSEQEAMLRSGRSVGYFRARFAEWAQEGNARQDGRRRLYRECIVPRRADLDAAREAAKQAAGAA